MPLEYLYDIRVKCPYCGFENVIKAKSVNNSYHPNVVTCDSEEGGCDRFFGVKITLSVITSVYEMQERS